MTQPEALRLADALDRYNAGVCSQAIYEDYSKAAAELRRQHALLQEWKAKAATWLASPEAAQRLDGYRELSQRANRAEAQRDALLKSLKEAVDVCGWPNVAFFHKALAAIKQAEGENT